MISLIDFVENFHQRSSDDLIESIHSEPVSIASMKEDFLDLLADQTEAMGPDSLPELEQGELRPIVGNAITDLAAGGIRMSPNLRTPSFGDQNAEQFALDVRSLLLYAHTVVVPNPFAAPLVIEGPIGHPKIATAPQLDNSTYLFSLEYIARLGHLIRHNVVFTVGTVPTIEPDVINGIAVSLELLIPDIVQQLLVARTFAWSDQTDLYMRARTLAERFLRQDLCVASLSDGRATRLLSCEAERIVLPAFSTVRSIDQKTTDSREPWVIDELVRLQLQGAGRIKLADMVAIRDDESFTIFRRDMAEAVTASTAASAQGDLYSRQVVVAEELRAAATRLKLETRKSRFLSATLGDAVLWAVGGIVGNALAGWPGALAGLAAKGAVDVARSGPTRPERALRAHYVELSRHPDPPKPKSARHQLLERRPLDGR